jgi:hypothetical protein
MTELEKEQITTETLVSGIDGEISQATEEQFLESIRLTEWTKVLE